MLDELVQARYQRRGRLERLVHVNLALERTRHLFRISRAANPCSRSHFEGAMRRLDEIGRMLHGWRTRLAGQGDAS